jgi:hypothetical protein
MDVGSAEHGDDQKIRQDKGPAAGPRSPEPATQIRDKDPDLDREWAREGLRDRDRIAHLFFREPAFLGDQLFFHQSAERHGTAKTERAQAQEIGHDFSYGATRRRDRRMLWSGRHHGVPRVQLCVSPCNERHQA